MFLLTFHLEELIQIRKTTTTAIFPCDQGTLQGKQRVAHLALPSTNLKVNPDGQGP